MYRFEVKNKIKFIVDEEIEKISFIKHAYSTNIGGVSKGERFSGLNLGFSTEDENESVRENYKLFSKAIGIDLNDFVLSNQIHEDIIYKAGKKDRGKGVIIDSNIKGVDGLITNEKNVAITLFSADCTLILAVDIENKAIGACHAGWKGTVKSITKKLIKKMEEEYGTKAENVKISILPAIGACCFEVRKDVEENFRKTFGENNDIISSCGIINGEEKFNINLWNANKKLLLDAGVRESNISVIDLCTCCNDYFYSYRRDGKGTGRMAAVIEII